MKLDEVKGFRCEKSGYSFFGTIPAAWEPQTERVEGKRMSKKTVKCVKCGKRVSITFQRDGHQYVANHKEQA